MNTRPTGHGQWQVNIRRCNNNEIVKAIPCNSRRQAEKVERGVGINLNHIDFYTEAVFAKAS